MDGPREKCMRYQVDLDSVPSRTQERRRQDERQRKAQYFTERFATPATETGITASPVAGPSNVQESEYGDSIYSDHDVSSGFNADIASNVSFSLSDSDESLSYVESDSSFLDSDSEYDSDDWDFVGTDTQLDSEQPEFEEEGGEEHDRDLLSETELLTSGEELYPGAPITTVVSYALIMMFGIKHNLTYVAFQDLIKLIQAHCPKSKKLARSLYKTKKFFTDRLCKETKQTTHYCCRICQKILAGENSVCDNDKCRNAKAMEFYSLDIESQIQRFFEGEYDCHLGNIETVVIYFLLFFLVIPFFQTIMK